jgi:hypothetical protein
MSPAQSFRFCALAGALTRRVLQVLISAGEHPREFLPVEL